jgi:hypothetical protein
VLDPIHELAQVVDVALFLGFPPGKLWTNKVIESVWQQTLHIAKRTPSKYWRFTSRLRERRVLEFGDTPSGRLHPGHMSNDFYVFP